ncbi:DUF6319 family protein [Gordonia sp. VNK21]|uniref:DUF6319 family protein n=1 Tax=Gordonia sp. VNK21 TaxID=3382483 RepID=UPI0038D356FE
MPPRRRSPHAPSLTPEDLAALTEAVAQGRRATVYLREGTPSLGLEPGSSARVISVSGTTLLLKPRGVNDELPFEADEVRMTRTAPEPPARSPKKKAAPTKTAAPKKSAAPKKTPSPTKTAAPKAAAPKTAAPKTAAAPVRAAKPPARPAAGGRRAPSAVTVTIFGSSDNQWSVAVGRGGRKPPRSRPVTPEAVDAALAALGDDAALAAGSAVLNHAREAAQRRVEELAAELEAARRTLYELGGEPSS